MTAATPGARRRLLAAAGAALVAALVLVLTAWPGPGLRADSIRYLGAASSLVHHGVLEVPRVEDWVAPSDQAPLAWWPPGMSVAIAGAEALGARPLVAARMVNAIGAGLAAGAAVWCVAEVAGTGWGLLALVMLVVTPAFSELSADVLSEPLFLGLLGCTLVVMRGARRRPVLGGMLAALATLARYAGASLIAAVATWELLRAGSARERIRRAVLAGAPGAVALGIWIARVVSETGGTRAIRTIALEPNLVGALRTGAGTLARWIWPAALPTRGVPLVVLLVAVAVLGAATVVLLAGRRSGGAMAPDPVRAAPAPTVGSSAMAARTAIDRTAIDRTLAAAALLGGWYVAFLICARAVADAGIPFDDRLLSPVMYLGIIGVVGAMARAAPGWSRAGRRVALGVAAAWVVASGLATYPIVVLARKKGRGYAALQWRDSQTLAWLRRNAPGRPVVSNFPAPIYLQAGRVARRLPHALDSATLDAFADTLRRRRALVVLFDPTAQVARPRTALLGRLPVREIARLRDGTVWTIGECGERPNR